MQGRWAVGESFLMVCVMHGVWFTYMSVCRFLSLRYEKKEERDIISSEIPHLPWRLVQFLCLCFGDNKKGNKNLILTWQMVQFLCLRFGDNKKIYLRGTSFFVTTAYWLFVWVNKITA